MTQQRGEHGCAVVHISDTFRAVVVAGGCCPLLTSVERLVMPGDDYTDWYWETLTTLSQARAATKLSPTLNNTGVRIIGGSPTSLIDVLELEPADISGNWTKVAKMTFKGYLHTLASILAC